MIGKRYSKKEPILSLWIVFPFIIILSFLLFGKCIFTSYTILLTSALYNSIYFFIKYFTFGSIALIVKNQLPADNALFKRIGIMLSIFYVLDLGLLYGSNALYKTYLLISCPLQTRLFWWTYIAICIMSTTITLLNEGVANWEKWKASILETERFRSMYKQSRILGLKGQINSHFLFNCFNSLSELITEDEKKAERFLEEMTSVHRYLLKNSNEYLASVEEEMQFVQSYFYLTKVRFGNAITLKVLDFNITTKQMMPPLSMHVILEHIIYTNAIDKHNPLSIEIEG